MVLCPDVVSCQNIDRPVLTNDSHSNLPVARRWGVAQTKSRCEKKFEQFLCERNVPCFLPLVKRRNVGNREIRFFHIPLFANYVFFDTSAISRTQAMASNRIVQILDSDDPEKLKQELEFLAYALQADEFLTQVRYKEIGMAVHITKGPFKGVNGDVVRIDNKTRLLIRISFICQAACIEIDESWVEPVI